ncbi:MAG: T9SS type A sorting domain-containing protein [Thermonemataceae bacterium]
MKILSLHCTRLPKVAYLPLACFSRSRLIPLFAYLIFSFLNSGNAWAQGTIVLENGTEIPTQAVAPGTPEIPDRPAGCQYKIVTEYLGHTTAGYHSGIRSAIMEFPIQGPYRAKIPPACQVWYCWENWDDFVIDARGQFITLTDNIKRDDTTTFTIKEFEKTSKCCDENPCDQDDSARFRFGIGSFACANPVAPITSASYIVLSDGTSYELNLWDNDGNNQGSYCGDGVPDVEAVDPAAGRNEDGSPIYRPIPVVRTNSEGEPVNDDGSPLGVNNRCIDLDVCSIVREITLTSDVEVWNADDPFNIREHMTVKRSDGTVIDNACVYWYVEQRFHDEDDNGRREIKKLEGEEEENYFFMAEPNLDQWGPVTITAAYFCNGRIFSAATKVEGIDAGIYFRNANGDVLRWNEGLYEKDPSLYDGFYDPSKKTMLFSHGWSPGGTMTHTNDPVNAPVRNRQKNTGIGNWHNEGWNVMLFFWTQYASTRAGIDPALLSTDLLANNADDVDASPFFASVHAARPNPRWFRTYPKVEVTTEAATSDPMGVVAGKRFKEIRDNLGGDPSKEVRFVGHSFGHTVITKATEWLHQNSAYRVDRMAWLDPAMDVEGLVLHQEFTMSDPSVPIIEWYQTSTYDLAFQMMVNQMFDDGIIESPTLEEGIDYVWVEILGGVVNGVIGAVETLIGVPLAYANLYSYGFVTNNADVSFYNELIVSTTYVRLHPLWEGGYPTGAQLLHSSATSWYLSSIADPFQPTYIEKCPKPDESCENGTIQHDSELDDAYGVGVRSFPFDASGLYIYSYNPDVTLPNGPSAAATDIQLGVWKGLPLEQIKGVATFSRADDYFTTRTQLAFDPIPNNARVSTEGLSKVAVTEDIAERGDGYAFPNPFEATFSFEYTLEKAGAVSIQVYDMTGHLIDTPTVETQQSKGNHRLEIDGSAWKQGLYNVLLTKPDGTVITHRVSKQ